MTISPVLLALCGLLLSALGAVVAGAGAANVVWNAAQWGEFVQRTTGNWLG